jgi:hypothetical protein
VRDVAEVGQLRQRAADLERARGLQVLGLEYDLAADAPADGCARNHGVRLTTPSPAARARAIIAGSTASVPTPSSASAGRVDIARDGTPGAPLGVRTGARRDVGRRADGHGPWQDPAGSGSGTAGPHLRLPALSKLTQRRNMSVAPWFLDTSSPDEVARANFPIVRRGFDPVEVQAFARAVGTEIARLQALNSEYASGCPRPSRGPNARVDETTVAQFLGEESSRLLLVARDTANEVRARAEDYANVTVRGADTYAKNKTTEADAYHNKVTHEADAEAARTRREARGGRRARAARDPARGRPPHRRDDGPPRAAAEGPDRAPRPRAGRSCATCWPVVTCSSRPSSRCG